MKYEALELAEAFGFRILPMNSPHMSGPAAGKRPLGEANLIISRQVPPQRSLCVRMGCIVMLQSKFVARPPRPYMSIEQHAHERKNRMQPKMKIDLFQYLVRSRKLMVDHDVARRFYIPREALIEILREGLGPEPMPAEASGRFWFSKGLLPCWKSWVREASDEDVSRTAEIIQRHDSGQRIPEYSAYCNDDPRSFLATVFGRRCR